MAFEDYILLSTNHQRRTIAIAYGEMVPLVYGFTFFGMFTVGQRRQNVYLDMMHNKFYGHKL